MRSEPRIAFVIDTLRSFGGGERVLLEALELFPTADIFTLFYRREKFRDTPFASRSIETSFIDYLPLGHLHHGLFLPLMPAAVNRFRLLNYDIVVSFCYAVAHGINKVLPTKHLAYTFTPLRYAWTNINVNGKPGKKSPVVELALSPFRKWDVRAASKVDQFASISQVVSNRIKNSYGRDSVIIHPPVDVSRFEPSLIREKYFVIVSRLVPHKRLDIGVKAFNKLGYPLLIIGEGPERMKLERMALSNITFKGFMSDSETAQALNHARGYISTNEEDFGIAIVEAQAAGCPVISLARGGALETVIHGSTGIFFEDQSVDSLIEAVQRFEGVRSTFRIEELTSNAKRFDKSIFKKRFAEFVGLETHIKSF